jgi:hypothetical protein
MYAMTTTQGTAAAETALCPLHDSPTQRENAERRAAEDVSRWEDCTGNDVLKCIVCGARDDA